MQGRPVEMEEVTQSDFIEINLNDVQVEAIPRVEIADATHAFKVCMRQFVIKTAVQEYGEQRGLVSAIAHGMFCEDGKISLKKIVKTAGSAGLAAAASTFSLKPAEEAVKYLSELFTGETYFPGQQAVVAVSQLGNVTRTIILVNFSSSKMFDKYFNRTPEAIVFLTMETPVGPGVVRIPKSTLARIWEKVIFSGRKIFDVSNAVAANLPVLLTTLGANAGIAITSFAAFLPLYVFAMDDLHFYPEKKYPARDVLVNYMRNQLHTFLMMTPDRQAAIIAKIKTAEEREREDEDPEIKDKELFTLLLNLSKPDESEEEQRLIRILQDYPDEWYKKVVANGLGGMSAFSQLPFTEAAGVQVARLFADPSSASAIAAGVIFALLSALPTLGLAAKSGYSVGAKMFMKHPTLGTIVNPELRDTLKWLVMGINLIAGGTSITFTYNATKDFANLIKLSAEATRILEFCMIGTNYTFSTIAFGQYVIDAMDELAVFIAKQYGDEKTKRLIDFVTGYSRLIQIMEKTNVENFCDITANWMLAGDPEAENELRDTMRAMVSAQLSDAAYAKFRQDLTDAYDVAHGLKDSHTDVLGARLTNDTYIVSPSFLDRHQGLRRRVPVRGAEGDIEMQFESSASSLRGRA